MKLVSWNVNGIRACLQKGFLESFKQLDADIFCVQETKMQEGQADIAIEGYYHYLNSAVKKGYSGTLIYTKRKPIHVFYGMNKEEHDQEGRLISLEFEDYYVITCYTPNSQNELKRLDYRQVWEDDFLEYLLSLDKPIILCGDLNVAHQEIDLKNPESKKIANILFNMHLDLDYDSCIDDYKEELDMLSQTIDKLSEGNNPLFYVLQTIAGQHEDEENLLVDGDGDFVER